MIQENLSKSPISFREKLKEEGLLNVLLPWMAYVSVGVNKNTMNSQGVHHDQGVGYVSWREDHDVKPSLVKLDKRLNGDVYTHLDTGRIYYSERMFRSIQLALPGLERYIIDAVANERKKKENEWKAMQNDVFDDEPEEKTDDLPYAFQNRLI